MGGLYLSAYAVINNHPLSPNALRVLMRMAAMAQDHDTTEHREGRYFGGYRNLTMAVGLSPIQDNEPVPNWAKRKIAAAIAELREFGLVELAPNEEQGEYRNRVYRLNYPTDPRWYSMDNALP